MMYIIFFLIVSTLMLISFRNKKFVYFKDLFLPISCITFILCLILFPDTSFKSASKGIHLWLTIVFPSLFPFFVASELLSSTGFIRALGILLEPIMRPLFNVPGCGSFALAMGITSGYPIGAKITSSMREEGLLTKKEAERLLSFTNNSGPLFIVGSVAVGMFKMPQVGLILLLSHIAASITVGILFRFYGEKGQDKNRSSGKKLWGRAKKEMFSHGNPASKNFGILLGNAVKNSITTILAIGGFIVLFSVIINLLLDLGIIHGIAGGIAIFLSPLGIHKETVTALISGFFEITTGTSMASTGASVSLIQKLCTASMIIGWAGLSVHSQVLSIISKTDISVKPYLVGKFLQGVISSCFTFLLLKISGSLPIYSLPVFSTWHSPNQITWQQHFLDSCTMLAYTLAALVLAINFLLIAKILLKTLIPKLNSRL
ncbi:MAG: sporulation integral membrane protein YlbJ [Clostridia bacterium]|nr:sporulation integral membrane protein YlbJ [Clostridia bacterium]